MLQRALGESGIKLYGGERAAHALGLPPAEAPKKEYGSRELTLELVSSFDEAVDHIHTAAATQSPSSQVGMLSQKHPFFVHRHS